MDQEIWIDATRQRQNAQQRIVAFAGVGEGLDRFPEYSSLSISIHRSIADRPFGPERYRHEATPAGLQKFDPPGFFSKTDYCSQPSTIWSIWSHAPISHGIVLHLCENA
jgi:hypothetical protein